MFKRKLFATLSRSLSTKGPLSTRLYIEKHGNPPEVLKIDDSYSVTTTNKGNNVKLRLIAAPVNPADINFIEGVYPSASHTFPCGVGFEGAFFIDEIENSSSSKFNIGDCVIVPEKFIGTWASSLTVPEDDVLKVPGSLSHKKALISTMSVNPPTAYRLLSDFAELKEGDTIVQNAASSHVGQVVIQLCKTKNITSVNIIRDSDYSDSVKKDLIKLGASYVFTESEAARKTMQELIGKDNRSAKLGFNCVGDKSVLTVLKLVEKGASVVTIGGMSKRPLIVTTSSLVFENKRLEGFRLQEWMKRNFRSEQYLKMVNELFDLMESEKLVQPLYTKFLSLLEYKRIFERKNESGPTHRYIFEG